MKKILRSILLSLIPVAYWILLDALVGLPVLGPRPVGAWLFTLGIFGLAALVSRRTAGNGFPSERQLGLGFPAVLIVSGLAVWKSESVIPAWAFLVFFYSFLLWADRFFSSRCSFWPGLGARLLLLAMSGTIPSGLKQITVAFGEEEFFAALEALALTGFWVVLSVSYSLSGLPKRNPPPLKAGKADAVVFALVLSAFLAFIFVTLRSYQHSFFDPSPPGFPGISGERPWVCGRLPAGSDPVEGRIFWEKLVRAVESKPMKDIPDAGWLALATADPHWRRAFRAGLLEEAGQSRFTGPAHSVKFGQYEAALRAYFYHRVSEAEPGLFTPPERERLRSWFGAINRRAQTVEWVDYLYGLAFSSFPQGPYENQEIGAGLLSLLEFSRLAAPEWGARNRQYLRRLPRGWAARFRNTDDAYAYQAEWLYNAYLQQLYRGESSDRNRRLSFEWLLLQALPDGSGPDYNLPGASPLAEASYLGALLLQDPRYLWLASRSLDRALSRGGRISVPPGIERPTDLTGIPPEAGSCLLYGDSGLPTQRGPLAPDKIVFRDGWDPDSLYLLLNLRFAGWHRYKATNTVTLLYQEGTLTGDRLERKSFGWLPAGRRVLRDKRIPRENLNGLVIERSGLSRVLYQITGMGGPWAQDPPHCAAVESFETASRGDRSTTRIQNWHGWDHRRTIHFVHGGPVAVVDRADGPASCSGAVVWQLPDGAQIRRDSVSSPEGSAQAVPVLLTIIPGNTVEPGARGWGEQDGGGNVRVASRLGRIRLVTVFLTRGWAGARAHLVEEQGRFRVEVRDQGRLVVIPVL